NKGYLITMLFLAICFFFACENDDQPQRAPSRYFGKLTVEGRERSFRIQIPEHDDAGSKVPVVFMLHGTGGGASQAERDYGWTEKATRENFIIVYPEGVPGEGRLRIRTWNAGKCCQYAMDNNVNDVRFVGALLDHLIEKYPVDETRVYVAGMSNGAMLAYRLACEIPARFAAIATVSGTMMVKSQCSASQAIPLVHIHSRTDTKVPYAGGLGIGGYRFTPVDSAIQVIRDLNGCSQVTRTEHAGYTHELIASCAEGTTMETYLLEDGGHSWPCGQRSSARSDVPSTAIRATDVIWEFFSRHKR